MTTTVSPASVFGLEVSTSSAIRTPAAAHLSTIPTCQSTSNHSRTDSAMTPPTPSTAASSSMDADRIASSEPKCPASARAAVGPTCLIDSATSTRQSGCDFACSRLATSFCPLAESTRPARTASGGSVFLAARVNSGTVASLSCAVAGSPAAGASVNRSPSSAMTPASSSAIAPSQPSASMSSAPREARPNSRSRSCAGQNWLLGQRMSLSPSFAGRSGVPHSGHSVGITNSRSVPSRRATTGPTISGMTSPALRSTTVSPIRTPLRVTSPALCSVACSTVDPATSTGSITP